jgi:LytS/YehU family sensor histidine kinase
MTIIGVFTSKYIIDLFIHQLDNYTFKSHIFSTFSEYVLVCLIFYALYAIKKSYQLSSTLKTAKLKNLKSQINPHFLFNTLNNIYSYSIQNDGKASELILKLSDNFKYVFHEGQNEKVELRKDWEHLKDFISISKYRWENKLTFEINEEFDAKNHLISPLILITFIENAVKYTTKLKGNNHIISIDLNVQNNELFLKCSNPCNSKYSLEKDWESSGIGLTNTIKRLGLLYPKNHNLKIEESKIMFVITLEMTLC